MSRSVTNCGALTASGDDPIRRLKKLMVAPKDSRPTASGENAVSRSLRRLVFGTISHAKKALVCRAAFCLVEQMKKQIGR
jgi:hypothetical protein